MAVDDFTVLTAFQNFANRPRSAVAFSTHLLAFNPTDNRAGETRRTAENRIVWAVQPGSVEVKAGFANALDVPLDFLQVTSYGSSSDSYLTEVHKYNRTTIDIRKSKSLE
jgi:hypothetical protein